MHEQLPHKDNGLKVSHYHTRSP